MRLENVEQVNSLRDRRVITSVAAHELRRHLGRGDEVIFVTPETYQGVGLTEEEIEFCSRQLAKGYTWTFVFRPRLPA